jgi:RimJ/RimL family protein N-acetyltransferase
MTTVDASIRQASEDDGAAIAGIIARVVQEPNPVGFQSAMDADQVKAWLRRLSNQGCIFIAQAEPDGTVAGFGALDFNTETPDTATIGVWILPEYRRRGLATQIGENLLEFAREAGYKQVRGRLPANNEPALSFLSGLGALVPLRNPEMRFELPL